MPVNPTPAQAAPPWGWCLLLLAGLLIYTLGLDGQYMPSNGDELVYSHIARRTAESGHWLPLVSDLPQMRNTKPPLLFWQGMVAGDWGAHWSQAALRLPSLLYTLVLTLLLAFTAWHLRRDAATALRAACLFLAFTSTLRYGRPYLTSAPETFWLALPMLALLRRPSCTSTLPSPLGWLAVGACWALGIGHKSFALLLPAAVAYAAAVTALQPAVGRATVLRITFGCAMAGTLALAFFGLWFVLDPDPAAVWREFIVGENAGKLANAQGYWHEALLGGGSSMPAQLFAYVQNAGLLAPVVLLAMLAGGWWLARAPSRILAIPNEQRVPLVWLSVWLLVFMLPSQRSARYLIPAMPALALLLALHWQRLPRFGFMLTLVLVAPLALLLARIAQTEAALGVASEGQFAWALGLARLTLVVVLIGLARARTTRATALAAVLLLYALLQATLAPLDGQAGQYDTAARATVRGLRVAVPSSFNGQFERFRFLLPQAAAWMPYDGERRTAARGDDADTLQARLEQFDAVVWLPAVESDSAPPCLPRCRVLGQRWELKGRHASGEITLTNLWQPEHWLLRREWLLARARP